ncbi:MAG: hypothetical protein AAGP08_14375 [Pseudomonadota bacterium]
MGLALSYGMLVRPLVLILALLSAAPALADVARLAGTWLCSETRYRGGVETMTRLEARVTETGRVAAAVEITFRQGAEAGLAQFGMIADWRLEGDALFETPVEVTTLYAEFGGEDRTRSAPVEDMRLDLATPVETPSEVVFYGTDLFLIVPPGPAPRVMPCHRVPL